MKKLVLLASLFFYCGSMTYAMVTNDTLLIVETVCHGECIEINNTDFCQSGVFVVEVANGGDTTVYFVDLTVLPRLETVLSEGICQGECFDYNGTELCESGAYEFEFVTSLGCDSTVTIQLEVLPASQPQIIIGNTGPLDCINNTAFLLASSSVPNSSYFWEGPDIHPGNENVQAPEIGLPGIYTVTVTSPQGCSATASTEVFGNPDGPEVSISGNDPLTCNNLSNTIIASTSHPDVTYEWTGPGGFYSTSPEIEVDETGDYYLTVETGNGCVTEVVVEVIYVQEPLNVDAGPNRHIQCLFTLQLNAPGAMGNNLGYVWSTSNGNILSGGNTLTPTVNMPGTYTLTVIDLTNGCFGSDDMVVYPEMTVISEPVLTLDCNNPQLTIDASESYNGPDAHIQWTTFNGNIVSGGNTLTPVVDAPGTYQLVIVRLGCMSFKTVIVLNDTHPPTVEIESDGHVITCNGYLELKANTNATNPVFEWFLDGNPISNEQEILAIAGGLYELTVTGENGCSKTVSVQISVDNEPVGAVIYGDLQLDCNLNGVGTLNVFASGPFNLYFFNWTTQNGVILSNPDFQNISILGPGTYCVEITNPLNGCVKTICTEVTAISPISSEVTVVDASCNSSNDGYALVEVFDGTLPYTFEWSNGATVPELFNLSPGTYSVTIADASGCFDYQTVEIGVSSTSTIIADAGGDQYFDCQTNLLVLDGGSSEYPPNATIAWTTIDGQIADGGNTLFPTITAPGTYLLTITDQFGCEDTDEAVVFETTANAGPSQVLDCNNTSVQLDGSQSQNGVTYLWTTLDGNIVDGETTLTPTVDAAGTYTLTVSSANGCTATDSVEVSEDVAQPDLNAQDISQQSCVETVTLEATSNDPGVTFEWFDNQGQSLGMDAEALEPGNYIVVATGTNGCTSETTIEVIDERIYPEADYPSPQYFNCFNGDPLLLDFEVVSPDDVDVAWSTSNGNIVGQQGSSVLVSQGGIYEVLMTETTGGCTSTAGIAVIEGGVDVTISSTDASCGNDDGTATVTTSGINNPVFEWNNGGNTSTISGLAPGTYSVTVSSSEGNCEEEKTVEVLQDPGCLTVISGYVYNDDATLACDPDGDVIGLGEVTVQLLPDDIFTTTDMDGYYEFLVPAGDYTLKALPVSPYEVICPDDGMIEVSIDPGGPGSNGNNFFLDILGNFELYGFGNSSIAQPGQLQYYQITYCNYGFQTIGGTLVFTHDPALTGFDPNAAGATSYDPATFTATWDFEDLSYFECEFVNFTLQVPASLPPGTVIVSQMVVQPILGDMNPSNNSYSWNRAVQNPSPNSITGGDQVPEAEIIREALARDKVTQLLQNQPNPFKISTVVPFYLVDATAARLSVFDSKGRLVRQYEGFTEGYNEVNILAADLGGNGLYYYRLQTNETILTGKMILTQ